MSKKFGKFLLFSAVAGAAAYGAYQYLQKKDKITPAGTAEEPDEDFDDFSEDLDGCEHFQRAFLRFSEP